MNTPEQATQLATMKETQALLKLSRPTIYELIDAGDLETLHFGRALRITMRSIDALLRKRIASETGDQGD